MNRRYFKQVAALVVIALVPTVTWAQPSLTIAQRAGAPAGFVTNVLTVNTPTDLTNFSITVEGGPHTFFDHNGIAGEIDFDRASAVVLGIDALYDFDTYVRFKSTPATTAGRFGASSHPRFGDPVTISPTDFIVSAFNTDATDTGSFEIAQITIADTANGNMFYSLFDTGGQNVMRRESITNGVIGSGFVIPVPGAIWMGGALLSGMGLIGYCRRKKN